MVALERLESRVLACVWAPQASHVLSATWIEDSPAGVTELPSDVSPAGEPAYNTPFLTDAQLEHYNSMSAAEIRAFLASRGSYFRQTITDVDGVQFDPATVIAQAAAQHRINPKVILVTLQKEHSGVTRTTRPTDSQMRFLMGCVTPTTARAQLNCAAERFRSYHNSLINNGVTVSGWRVGVAKTTQDGVSVTPATRAVAGQFTYTPYAGIQWGGNRAGVGGVYLFYNNWNAFGFGDSTRPNANLSGAPPVTTTGGATYTFSVTFSDDAGIDASDFISNNNAVRVTGPNGFDQPATYVSTNAITDGTPRTVTYRVAAPGGSWDFSDRGTYTVSVREAQVSDVNNNFVAPRAVGTFQATLPATVVARRVFYNNSAFDGRSPSADARDDTAIAPDKTVLLPGSAASSANVTSYSKGINGLMLDVRGLGSTPTAADFVFQSGNGGDPGAWPPVTAPVSIARRNGAGTGASDRLTLTFPDGAVRNTWLRVTVRPTAATALAAADVFYVGNAVGETFDAPAAGTTLAAVTPRDYAAVRARLNAAGLPLADRYDFDRDGRVTLRDLLHVRSAMGFSLQMLTAV